MTTQTTTLARVVTLIATFAVSFSLAAAELTLPDLFKRAKAAFAAGDFQSSLRDFELLDSKSSEAGFEKDRAQLAPVITFYRAANLASLGRKDDAREQFIAYLGYMPNASITSPPYSKQVVAALDAARKQTGGNSATMAVAYERFAVPAGWSLPANAAWSSTPVRYLLTPSQKKEYDSLATDAARAEFVDRFWAQLDPTAGTPENEFRREFERRLAYADSAFTDGETRGLDTDRAAVFAILGPPTYAGVTIMAASDDVMTSLRAAGNSSQVGSGGSHSGRTLETDVNRGKRESWYYRQGRLPAGIPYKEVRIEFVSKQGYGKGVLQKDPEPLKTIGAAAENARAKKKLN